MRARRSSSRRPPARRARAPRTSRRSRNATDHRSVAREPGPRGPALGVSGQTEKHRARRLPLAASRFAPRDSNKGHPLTTSITLETPVAQRASLADLAHELRAAGLGTPDPLRIYAKFFLLVAAAFALFGYVCQPGVHPVAQALLGALGAWFLTAAAMCSHDGAHNAASSKAWANDLLAHLGFTLLGGLSVTYWRHKHNALHHPAVNVALKDPDVQQGLLALSSRQHAGHGRLVRWLQQRFQGPVFWLVGAPLVQLDLKFTSLKYVLGAIYRGQNRAANVADLGWLVAHYLFWLVLPLSFWSATTTLALFGSTTVGCGFLLAAIFAPAHIPHPLVGSFEVPLLLQLTSTRNFKTNAFFRFTLVGLDHQVEHHIAPMIPHFQLRRAAVIVRAYCAKHGLPYHETTWLRALRDTHVSIRDGWKIDEVIVG